MEIVYTLNFKPVILNIYIYTPSNFWGEDRIRIRKFGLTYLISTLDMIYSLPCQFGEVVHSWELVAARLRCRNSLQRTGRRPSGARLRNESFRRWQDPGGDTAHTPQSSSTADECKINHLNFDGWMRWKVLNYMLLKGEGLQGAVFASWW